MMDVIKYAQEQDKLGACGYLSVREKNNPEFIEAFIAWCQEDDRVWSFENNKNGYEDARLWSFESNKNGYYGYTAFVCESYNPWVIEPLFEFAYSGKEKFVKVFTAKNNGYWVPEYISLKGDEARTMLDIMKTALLEVSGF